MAARREVGRPRPNHSSMSVGFAEHAAAGDLDGDGAEQKDGGVEPEDGGDGGGEPVVDVVVVGVEVAAGLGDEEDADEGDEEHEIAAEGEEEADAVRGRGVRGGRGGRGGGHSSCRHRHLAAGALVGWRTAA